MVHRPTEFSAFEFVVLSGLRAAQLMRGCTPRIESGHKRIVTAQIEVATGKVVQADTRGDVAARLKAWIGAAAGLQPVPDRGLARSASADSASAPR